MGRLPGWMTGSVPAGGHEVNFPGLAARLARLFIIRLPDRVSPGYARKVKRGRKKREDQ